MPESGGDWRRYLLLVLDAFHPDAATPLAALEEPDPAI
jgi:hypothetical protein